MRLLIGGRRSGKTTQAIQWLKKNPEATLIVHSEIERQRLLHTYRLEDHQVLTVGHASEKLRGSVSPVAIDNLDLYLGSTLHRCVDLVTATARAELLR